MVDDASTAFAKEIEDRGTVVVGEATRATGSRRQDNARAETAANDSWWGFVDYFGDGAGAAMAQWALVLMTSGWKELIKEMTPTPAICQL